MGGGGVSAVHTIWPVGTNAGCIFCAQALLSERGSPSHRIKGESRRILFCCLFFFLSFFSFHFFSFLSRFSFPSPNNQPTTSFSPFLLLLFFPLLLLLFSSPLLLLSSHPLSLLLPLHHFYLYLTTHPLPPSTPVHSRASKH